jgi:uncharacterized membrane protein
MASPATWRYLELFFDKFTLPHYILSYNGLSRSLHRETKHAWAYLTFNTVYIFGLDSILIYSNLKSAFTTTNQLNDAQRSLRVIFSFLFASIGALTLVCLYTIAFNQAKFSKNCNAICRFQPTLAGNKSSVLVHS